MSEREPQGPREPLSREEAQAEVDRLLSPFWRDTAAMFARSADYWRGRAERAERFYPAAWWWTFRRWVRNHMTARVSW
jgi:hypothetical protein